MLAGVLITLVSLWYGQNHNLLPVAASDEAELVDGLFDAMMTISVGLFILVEGVLIIAAIRFRRRKGDETDGPHIEGNIPLEILWTAIPAVIVLGISVYSFDIYTEMGGLSPMGHGMAHKSQPIQVAYAAETDVAMPLIDRDGEVLEPADSLAAAGIGPMPDQKSEGATVTVNVKALQYAFIFTYADTGIISGELRIPADRDVKLNMEAQDVIHAFWVPELRLKQDIIPGQETELQFIPRRLGTYPIICAELCGPYHGGMKAQMVVESPGDFDAWVESRIASQSDGSEVVATTPAAERSEPDYLAALVEPLALDVKADVLAQLEDEVHTHSHPHIH
ncbi:MAG: cytochrome c oxidase subunit II [Cyanothece sp. SIO1E1]|nr:cytochrome c oxidase subunit II [Cyanothece sp. SIO1E1]